MLTRRDLVRGLGCTFALAAVGGAGVAVAGDDFLMRPPGAQDEAHFMGTCIRCDRCRSVCPTHAIGVSVVEDGLIQARTPKMEFRIGYCNECEGAYRCSEVCPVGSIGAFDKKNEKIGVAVINPDACLTFGASGSCSAKCIDVCPEEALCIDENGRLAIDQNLCWGCGACECFCVSDSYGAYKATGRRGINVKGSEAL